MKAKILFTTCVFSVLFCQIVKAQDYHLFNPTPDKKLRTMSTERPSKSDGVNTIDPGRFQIETSFVSYTGNKDCDHGSCTKSTTASAFDTTNLRLGLTQNSDLQIIINPYVNKRVAVTATEPDQIEGFGDTTLRLKYSFSGNNSEKFGLALIPFVKIPTNQNDIGNNDVEGGIGLPFVVNFSDGLSLGGMTQLQLFKDQNTTDSYRTSYYSAYANAIYLSKSFSNKLAGYAEYYTFKADLPASSSWWQNSADFGVIYSVNDNFKIDAGANVGVTNASDDLNVFVGTAYRF